MTELCKEQIKEILPHREPMLLLDKLIIYDDKSARAIYHFKGTEYFFKGHYPDNPIAPGVILCEIMAQASCGLFINDVIDKTPYLISINNTKFRKTVRPNDILRVDTSILRIRKPFYYSICKSYIDDVLCAEGEFSFILK